GNKVDAFLENIGAVQIDAVAGIESRGFLFGLMLANRLNVPFVPIRKIGKLPYETVQQEYELEYGSAVLEVHADAIVQGDRILIHDDLLATGGTVAASSELIKRLGGEVAGFAFLVELNFLNGREKLKDFSDNIHVLASF
ncbi:MAG: adenine phosphoribosyltransferase, partial [Mucilaginibacter polytrichastri]|nr:adenine phosphoribosyltransferase [Mucilaginibacter polytrichastri]